MHGILSPREGHCEVPLETDCTNFGNSEAVKVDRPPCKWECRAVINMYTGQVWSPPVLSSCDWNALSLNVSTRYQCTPHRSLTIRAGRSVGLGLVLGLSYNIGMNLMQWVCLVASRLSSLLDFKRRVLNGYFLLLPQLHDFQEMQAKPVKNIRMESHYNTHMTCME